VCEPNLTSEVATNAVLNGCLTRLGWSAEQFASHLNELARFLRLLDEVLEDAPAVAEGQTAERPALHTAPALAQPGLCAVVTSLPRAGHPGILRVADERWRALRSN
jgi:hypothetical protein